MKFRILNADPLYDYREACATTQGKDISQEIMVQPKDDFKYWVRAIVANHSTIRSIHFRLVDTRPKTVINQIIRATKGHPQPEVESSRPDWIGKERSYNPYDDKMFMQDHTPESFIEMARQRLCNRTEDNTRKFMNEMVEELMKSDNPILKAVGYCCHPYCWWYKGCPELKPCGKFGEERIADLIIDWYKEEKR